MCAVCLSRSVVCGVVCGKHAPSKYILACSPWAHTACKVLMTLGERMPRQQLDEIFRQIEVIAEFVCV
jgi:hypothetical protein